MKGRGGANAKVASTDRLQEVISQSDVVFTATNSEVPVVLPAHVEGREKAIVGDLWGSEAWGFSWDASSSWLDAMHRPDFSRHSVMLAPSRPCSCIEFYVVPYVVLRRLLTCSARVVTTCIVRSAVPSSSLHVSHAVCLIMCDHLLLRGFLSYVVFVPRLLLLGMFFAVCICVLFLPVRSVQLSDRVVVDVVVSLYVACGLLVHVSTLLL